MLDCRGRQLGLLLRRDVYREGLEGRFGVSGTLLAVRRGVRDERHRGIILGTRDEGKVSGRSDEDAQITDWKCSVATAWRKTGIELCTEERRLRTPGELAALR